MKILLVNKFYYPAGGAERYVELWQEELQRHGHTTIPFAMQDDRNWPTPYRRHFTRPIRFDAGAPLGQRISAGLRSIYSFDAARHLRRLLGRTRPDIIHLNSYCYQLTSSILAPLHEARLPVFQTMHEYKVICANQHLLNPETGLICEECRGGRWYAPLFERCIKGSLGASAIGCVEQLVGDFTGLERRTIDCLIAPSAFMRRKMVAFGVAPQRVAHVPNFVRLDEFRPDAPPGDYFLFVGRLVGHKGLGTLLAAAAELPHVPLRILGDGPMRAEVERIVREGGLRQVEILGFELGERLRTQIEGARALVVPSEWHENCPLVVLEAMAAGRAVIGARIGGIPELVREGETGLLFSAGSRESLVACLRRLWEDKDEAAAMGAAGRRVAEQFYGPETHYQTMMALFQRYTHAAN